MSSVAQVTNKTEKPTGVISKRAQQYVLVGVAIVILLVAMFSSSRQRKAVPTAQAATLPQVQETNERKVADFGSELSAKQKQAEQARILATLPPPSNPPAPNGRVPLLQGPGAQPQYQSGYPQTGYAAAYPPPQYAGAPYPEERDQLAQHERERAYNSRFASNLAFAAPRMGAGIAEPTVSPHAPINNDAPDPAIAIVAAPSVQTTASQPAAPKKPVNVNVNTATGQPYVLFEGTFLETTLVNRLDGDFSGPIKVMVTNPVYSHDRQHVLVPEGSTILGEVKHVSGLGQRRLAVVFHRMLMPDGYSVDLDQFQGLNQIGETGLKDQVNNHYAQIFGASIALGVIAGAAESSASSAGIYQNGEDAYKRGVGSSLSQSGTHILDRFLSIPPTLTVREGHRIKVYMTQDLLLPAYENHTVPPNI